MAKQFDCFTIKIPRFVRSLIVCEKIVYTENICLWKYLVVTAKNSTTYDNEFFSQMITSFTIRNLEITVRHEYSGLFEN